MIVSNDELGSIFSGIQKFSTIDDPGNLSITLFTSGCNFRCRYCHNSNFITGKSSRLDNDKIFDFLRSRVGIIDSVVICGGEPTIHKSLPDWIRKIKSMGFRIKLDTNATNPEMVFELINKGLVDFFAIDYKAPINKYDKVTGIDPRHFDVLATIEIVAKSGVPYDIRTTVHTDLLSRQDILDMVIELKSIGVKNYSLQGYVHSDGVYDKTLKEDYSNKLINEIEDEIKDKFDTLNIRNVW